MLYIYLYFALNPAHAYSCFYLYSHNKKKINPIAKHYITEKTNGARMTIVSKQPKNVYKDVACPDCTSKNWRKNKDSEKFVCMKCGCEYETKTLKPEKNR